MTIAYFILSLLSTLSDVIETTYALGEFTRTTILPALVYIYVVGEATVNVTHKTLIDTYDIVSVYVTHAQTAPRGVIV
jgi:hypothetical protein